MVMKRNNQKYDKSLQLRIQGIQCESKRYNQIKCNQQQQIQSGLPMAVFGEDEWIQFSIVYQVPNRE